MGIPFGRRLFSDREEMKTLILVLVLASPAWAEILVGTAVNLEGEFVYTEEHVVERDAEGLSKKIETSYFAQDGKIFAKMISDFADQGSAPNSKFEDFRFHRTFEGKYEKKGSHGIYKINELSSNKLIKTTELTFQDDLVSGSGFDNYIKQNLTQKKSTQSSVHFLVLPRHDYYKFVVLDKGLSKDGLIREYVIKPATWLSLFVDEITISYDAKSGLLKKYAGLSNLPSSKDKPQTVAIEYHIKSPVKAESP